MPDSYDVIVLGGGPTGENVAGRVSAGGLSTVLVEAELVGGECSFWACMPSKALLRPAAALADARRVAGAKQAVRGPLDVDAVLRRRDEFTHDWDDASQVDWLTAEGIDLVRGHGRLAGERTVEVAGEAGARRLTARHAVVVCTGSRPVIPPIPGLADVSPWTSRDATSAGTAPARLLVVGGGVVACELAAAWQALGSQVSMLVRGERLLARLEPFAGSLVGDGLAAAGVDVRLGRSPKRVVSGTDPPISVQLDDGSALAGDTVLAATGRAPRTGDLGLDVVGLPTTGALRVDDTGRVTGHPGGWLYAAGDVTGTAPLTHMGKYAGRASADAVLARARGEAVEPTPWQRWAATARHAAVPQVVFTDPEVAAVGLTEEEARVAGHPVRVVDYDLGQVAGASLYADGFTGQARLVVEARREVLLGATFVGPGVAELLHAATVAVTGEVPLGRLWHAVPAYPTMSEVWLKLLEGYGL